MLAVTFISLISCSVRSRKGTRVSFNTHQESVSSSPSSSSSTSIYQFQVHSTLPMKKSAGISPKSKLPMEKMEQFQCCWSSLSMEKKKEFLVIKIQDLRNYLAKNSSKKDMVITTFEEAISFGKMNHNQNHVSWEFWVCPLCDEVFTEEESHVQHILQRRDGGGLGLGLRRLKPRSWENTSSLLRRLPTHQLRPP